LKNMLDDKWFVPRNLQVLELSGKNALDFKPR
jgi:hypothetical protein